MTEQLALGQRGGERGAVDGDERLVAARTEPVQQPCPDFFAGTGFAADQNGATDIRGALDMRAMRLTLGFEPKTQLSGSSGASFSRDSIEGATFACVMCFSVPTR